MAEKYLTLAEAAERSRGRDGQPLAPVSLRNAILRGYLRGHKNGAVWTVSETDLRAYLRDRPRWRKPRRDVLKSR